MVSLEAFVNDQLEFIAAERDLEISETQSATLNFSKKELERRGLAVTNLEICGMRTGLGGKSLVELERANAVGVENVFFASIMRIGDIVRIEEQPAGSTKKLVMTEAQKSGVEGVVSKVQDVKLTVALSRDDEEPPSTNGRVWVVKLANSVTYTRMAKAMNSLAAQKEKATHFTRILLGLSKPSALLRPEDQTYPLADFKLFDTTLNETQQTAVKHALLSPEIALIHGPPGTGKTYTIIELIRQFVARDQRVLVCGPSNISVDNIVERLGKTAIPLVRLGHPARLLPSVVNHSLDVLTRTSSAGEIVKDIRSELDTNLGKVAKSRGKDKKVLYGEIKSLRKEFRQRERKCVSDIISSSKVVLATLHGSGSYDLQQEKFDVVIIDEASQALEASCWIPLLGVEKAILAGDHMQLSPMIKSKTSGATNPEKTLFERLLCLHGDSIKSLLNIQYRMNDIICKFPSDELYGGTLRAAEGVGSRLLTDLEDVEDTEDTREPLIFIDTQGGDMMENVDGASSTKSLSESKSNDYEADLVERHIDKLVNAGVKPDDIAVVTPYSAQVTLISRLLREKYPEIEIGTVDGFQGREKEAIVVSLVRSNEKHDVGFLAEKRRLNGMVLRVIRPN